MLTIALLVVIVILLGGGWYGHRTYGSRGLIGAVILALLLLLIFWNVSDERAIGPGVPPIIAQ